MFHHGIADDDAHIAWDFQKLVSESATVKKEGVICLAEAGNVLVHDAALRARELVLRALTQGGYLAAIKIAPGNSQEGESDRYFYRR
jgi:hypothetical protein